MYNLLTAYHFTCIWVLHFSYTHAFGNLTNPTPIVFFLERTHPEDINILSILLNSSYQIFFNIYEYPILLYIRKQGYLALNSFEALSRQIFISLEKHFALTIRQCDKERQSFLESHFQWCSCSSFSPVKHI